MRGWAIAIAAVLAAGCAAAGPGELYRTQDCNAATNQRDLNLCADANYAAADRALNDLYRQLMARQHDEASRLRLRDDERAWISYRDKDCARQVGPREGGGSIWPLDMATCLKDRTDARLRELKRSLDCPEGYNACPG